MSNLCWDVMVQGLGLHYTYPHISDEKRRWVQLQLHQRVAPTEIVRQNRESYINQHMMQTGITDRLAALQSLEAIKPPRDFYLTRVDVANIQAEQDKRDWRRSENQHESLLVWAQQHHSDVLILRPQTPLPGTPDYDWDQARRQAAIAQDMPSDAADGEIAAVMTVFPQSVKIFLCHWHVPCSLKAQLLIKAFLLLCIFCTTTTCNAVLVLWCVFRR